MGLLEKPLDPCVAEYSVTEPTRREACGSMCKLLLSGMVKNTGKVSNWQTGILRARQMSTLVNGRGLSICEQKPEGLTRGVRLD